MKSVNYFFWVKNVRDNIIWTHYLFYTKVTNRCPWPRLSFVLFCNLWNCWMDFEKVKNWRLFRSTSCKCVDVWSVARRKLLFTYQTLSNKTNLRAHCVPNHRNVFPFDSHVSRRHHQGHLSLRSTTSLLSSSLTAMKRKIALTVITTIYLNCGFNQLQQTTKFTTELGTSLSISRILLVYGQIR